MLGRGDFESRARLRTGAGIARWLVPVFIIALCLMLYLPGIRWGLPAVVSWSQDTIAGVRTLGAVQGWPGEWKGRYPPLHYLILRAAYEPLLSRWRETGDLFSNPQSDEFMLRPPHAPKTGQLFLISRFISVAMAIGCGLGLWFAARRLTGDDLAAAIATFCFLVGAGFTYFAHLGNVDVPSMMWFAWSLYFYARLLHSRSWLDAGWLGLFGALACSTKDAVAGMYPGMAVMLLVREYHAIKHGNHKVRSYDSPRTERLAIRAALLRPAWLIGVATFVLPCLFINGAFANPAGLVERLGLWLSPATGAVIEQEFRHTQPLLVGATIRHAAGAIGWPMLLSLGVATIYTILRRSTMAMAMLVPAIGYYLLVIAPIRFVYERFLFAPLACLFVLLGVAAAAWLRERRIHATVRCACATSVLLPTLAYAAAVDLEMIHDSRYQAEEWFEKNVSRPASVGGLTGDTPRFRPQYLPRVHETGYDTHSVLSERSSFEHPQPDYLILSSYDFQDFSADQQTCIKALQAGQLGYVQVAEFHGQLLYDPSRTTRWSWLSLAGWFAPPPGKISPIITVFRRERAAP